MNVRLVEAKNKKQVVKKKYLTASFFSCKIGKVIVMEEILKQTLLYDFYGELLTEHQKQVYEDVILNDYSLSEVAASLGISRQGVHDMVRRSSRLLEEYEAKLHLMERFVSLREKVGEIHKLAKEQAQDPKMAKSRRQLQSRKTVYQGCRSESCGYRCDGEPDSGTDGDQDRERRDGQSDGQRDHGDQTSSFQ